MGCHGTEKGKLFFVSHKLFIPADTIILSKFITNPSFLNSQLNPAFVLPPAQFSNVCQPFYFQPTSVNYHCHLSNTQHNVTVPMLYLTRGQTPAASLCYGHLNKPP